MSSRRPLLVLAAASLVLGVGCGGQNPFQTTSSDVTVSTTAPVSGDEPNVFLPEDQNLSDCVGTLQRPGCGSAARGGWRQYMTMGVLALGLAFVGWRIGRGVRARDAVVNATPPAGD